MTQLSDLLPASFRGARFLIGDVSTEGGRKQVVHEFPNSDRREIDDLGLLNKTYSITGLVKTSDARDALIRALDEEGQGELVHPVYGSVQVSAQPYTVTESTRDLGAIRFEMSFLRTEQQLFPTASPAQAKSVSNQADSVIAAAESQFGDRFEVTGYTNFSDALENLSNIADSTLSLRSLSTAVRTGGGIVSASFGAVQNNFDAVNDLARSVTSFSDNLAANLRAAPTLASTTTRMIQSAVSIFTGSPQAVVYAMTNDSAGGALTEYGSGQNAITETTDRRRQRELNRLLINSLVQFTALAEAYRAAVTIEFSDADSLEAVEQVLEAAYSDVISVSGFDDETNDELISLRTSVQDYFDTLTSNAAKVATVEDVKQQPITELTYAYYGTLENDAVLVDLNDFRDVSFVDGSLSILTP